MMICIILILAFRVASAFLYCSVSNWTEYSKRRFQIQNKRVDIRLIILLRVKEIFHMHTFCRCDVSFRFVDPWREAVARKIEKNNNYEIYCPRWSKPTYSSVGHGEAFSNFRSWSFISATVYIWSIYAETFSNRI